MRIHDVIQRIEQQPLAAAAIVVVGLGFSALSERVAVAEGRTDDVAQNVVAGAYDVPLPGLSESHCETVGLSGYHDLVTITNSGTMQMSRKDNYNHPFCFDPPIFFRMTPDLTSGQLPPVKEPEITGSSWV
jgi:hypothetical protein